MKKTQKSKEGYLLIDHRGTVGLTANGGAIIPNNSLMEYATITCKHCQQQIIRNPLRARDRHYCPKCDHYICDRCEIIRVASGGDCVTFEEIIAKVQEKALKGVRING